MRTPLRVVIASAHLASRGPSVAAVLLMLVPNSLSAAPAAEPQWASSEAIFLSEIIVLLVCGRLLGEAMQRIGQPAIMGQLIAGILLGPSVLGALWPDLQQSLFPQSREQKSMIDAVSQLGILMLLLLTGMETDLSVVRRLGRAALSVSIAGVSLPFVCGFALGELLPETMLPAPDQRLITSLFLGTALSISSVKIVAMVVREMNFMRRTVGQVIVAAAIIDDTIGWTIMAVTFGLASHGGLDVASLGQSVLGTAVFLLASFTIGRGAVSALIRWANDTLVSDVPVITTILVVTGTMALITHAIGVHTVLGAFVAGILIGQSPILTKHIDEQLRGLIIALFMPVFFGLAGLNANLAIVKNPSLLLLSLGFIVIASLGKFSGAFLGGAIGGLTWRESLAIGCGMNARGSTEVIVASIGLSMGALGQDLYTMIVAMAVVTTMAMPPMLRWALAHLPFAPEEESRLEREAIEARGFVTSMERLLVAVDDSATGSFASRLAGLLAGARSLPITVVHVAAATAADRERSAAQAAKIESVVKAAAEEAMRDGSASEAVPSSADITTRLSSAPMEQTIASEARKGYDFLVIGTEPTMAADSEFAEGVARLAAEFEGPFAVAAARGPHREDPIPPELRILAPVTGTGFSRRGAEVALALARAGHGSVLALHVATAAARRPAWRRRFGAPWTVRTRDNEKATLGDIVRLGEQLGISVRAAARRHAAAEEAILRQQRIGKHNLIVMGVSPRTGSNLFFGSVPAAVLARSDCSILFVSS
jgi:Kef-type K+ transport system membrane component KefB/nucleotide-binding universal stress UspA family protein